MSTQTEHLGLHQWEPSDPFLRTDFNEDFAKIDAGVGALAARLDGVEVTGSYTTSPSREIVIDLGFRPKLLAVLAPVNGYNAYLLIVGPLSLRFSATNNGGVSVAQEPYVVLTDNGFKVPAGATMFNHVNNINVLYTAFR